MAPKVTAASTLTAEMILFLFKLDASFEVVVLELITGELCREVVEEEEEDVNVELVVDDDEGEEDSSSLESSPPPPNAL